MYGDDFLDLVSIFYIIFPGIVVMSVASTLTYYFQAIGKAFLLSKIMILPILIQLSTGYYLVDWVGAVGVAFGFSVSLILTSIGYIAAFLFINKTSYSETLKIRMDDIRVLQQFIKNIISIIFDKINLKRKSRKK